MDGKLNIRSAYVFSETLRSLLILIFFVNSISDPILAIMLMPNLRSFGPFEKLQVNISIRQSNLQGKE